MGPTLILITARRLTRDDLTEFIVAQGGSLKAIGAYDGRVNSQTACVNLKWDVECDKDWLDPIEPFDSSQESLEEWKHKLALREEVRTKLGADPSACIILDLVRGEPTQRMAWRVIRAMFDAWAPCVLRSYASFLAPEQETWTLAELEALWAAEKRLPN